MSEGHVCKHTDSLSRAKSRESSVCLSACHFVARRAKEGASLCGSAVSNNSCSYLLFLLFNISTFLRKNQIYFLPAEFTLFSSYLIILFQSQIKTEKVCSEQGRDIINAK
jgi:hypothetical protein